MFYIVESEKQLANLFRLCQEEGCFLEVITSNDNYHPAVSQLVAVYLRPLIKEEIVEPRTGEVVGVQGKGYIIPIDHEEGLNVSRERIQEGLKSIQNRIFVLNKKNALYFFRLGKNCCDISLAYSMEQFQKLELESKTKTYNWFYNRYGDIPNLNQIIPISKLYEHCESRFDQVEPLMVGFTEPAGYQFYNELATKAFLMVEQEGLRVDVHTFVSKFNPKNPVFSIKGETAYTSYNLYNTTSRPTNSFNSVNFLAIPKQQEYRECFKPRYQGGHFAELDFDGYHIRLISDEVGYSLSPDKKAHLQIAALRTGRSEFTKEEYPGVKSDNFKMIYGTPKESDKELPLAQKIQELISNWWKDYVSGHVTDRISGKEFLQVEGLEDMYPSKLFNYMVQCKETSRNVKVLIEVLRHIAVNQLKSRVVLVTYDSFLVDVAPGEDQVVSDIQKIMENWGKTIYPVGVKTSKNLVFD